MKTDLKYMDWKKRLENIPYKKMIEGTNIETSFGREFVICSKKIKDGEEIIKNSYLQTIIPFLIGDKKVLIETEYYFLEGLEKGGVDMRLIFEDEPRYNFLMKIAKKVDLYNKLEENLK